MCMCIYIYIYIILLSCLFPSPMAYRLSLKIEILGKNSSSLMSSYILNQSTLALPRALLECSFPHLCPAVGNLQLHVAGHTGHPPPLAALEGRVQLPENWTGGSPREASVNCTAKALGPAPRLSRLPT